MVLGSLSKPSRRALASGAAGPRSGVETAATAPALAIDVRGVSLTFQTRDGDHVGPNQSLAAAAERARIAREMHDVVSHNIQVMVTLSES